MASENSFDYLPYFTEGKVVQGFGRGGAELGIPTANFPEDVIRQLPDDFVCGVYYGWACVNTLSPTAVYKMVMCCGWNTHFHNTMKTMETHIMHKFDRQFYGENLRIIILGYVRPMEAYDSLDALIQAMNSDINHAEVALSQSAMLEFNHHPFLTKETTPTTTTSTMCENDCTSRPVVSSQTPTDPSDKDKLCASNNVLNCDSNKEETHDKSHSVIEKMSGNRIGIDSKASSLSCSGNECCVIGENNDTDSNRSVGNKISEKTNNIQQAIKYGDSHNQSSVIVIDNRLNNRL